MCFRLSFDCIIACRQQNVNIFSVCYFKTEQLSRFIIVSMNDACRSDTEKGR